jgi:transcriptional regulator with XRE-family HTH domain
MNSFKKLREEAGYSQSALATEFGVDVAAVRNWDQKRRRPRFETLVKLAHVLNVSQDDIIAALASDAGAGEKPKRKKGGKR